MITLVVVITPGHDDLVIKMKDRLQPREEMQSHQEDDDSRTSQGGCALTQLHPAPEAAFRASRGISAPSVGRPSESIDLSCPTETISRVCDIPSVCCTLEQHVLRWIGPRRKNAQGSIEWIDNVCQQALPRKRAPTQAPQDAYKKPGMLSG